MRELLDDTIELLEELEWEYYSDGCRDGYSCPICWKEKHSEDCKFKIILDKLKAAVA